MKRELPMGLAVLLASGVGYLAMLAYVVLLGGHHRKFMFAMTTIVPVAILIAGPLGFVLLHRWLRLELLRFLLVGLAAGAWLYWLRGNQWGWHPGFTGDFRAALLLIGFPAVGAGAFCATLKRLAPDLGDI